MAVSIRAACGAAVVLCAAASAAAGTTTVNVNAGIQGSGTQQIGTLTVDPDGGMQGTNTFIEAEFALGPEFAYLDVWYDFRWVNVETGYTVDGKPVDENGDGNPDDPVLGELPAIDPQPVAAGGDDDKPFYWTDEEYPSYHTEGVGTSWEDDRGEPTPGTVVITFTTYLVASSVTDSSISGSTLCLLASFTWTSTIVDGGESTEAVTGTSSAPGAAGEAQVNEALGNAGGGGFPGGWSADSDCVLSECPSVIDCVYSSEPGVYFSPSTWTNDGNEIGTTFPDGKTPEPGVPQYDSTYLPSEANDWHWSVTLPWGGTTIEVTVWVEDFAPGTDIDVEIVCSEQFTTTPTMLMVNVDKDTYTLFDGPVPIFDGTWSQYPGDLPPSLGFELAGVVRQNFVACAGDLPCPSDLNHDGQTDGADLGTLLGSWGSPGATDLNCDGTTDGADLGLLLGGWGACDCGPVDLTQSVSDAVEPFTGVACFDDDTGFSSDNEYARSFDLAAFPDTAGQVLSVMCVDVGIETNTGSNLVCTVHLYQDLDGGPPIAPGVDLFELGSQTLLVPGGYGGGILQARFPAPVAVPPDATLVASLACPPHDDGLVGMGANNDGETGPTYIRAFGCDTPEFVTVESIGFPNADWVLHVHGDVSPPPEFPAENRGIESVVIEPAGAPGLYTIGANWVAETLQSDGPKDLSTIVTYSVNGLIVGSTLQPATTAGASGPCLGTSPPCDGSECGTWNFGIVTLNGFCKKSIASVVGIEFCTCACVVLTVSEKPIPLQDGDVITVTLSPAPGSLPEQVTGDDQLTVTFQGGPVCPGEGPCFEPHPGPGCEDPLCCETVCDVEPICCELQWDLPCVQIALQFCGG
ncbi:MAG: hypothetical protein KDA22_03755 [Phycisphaerales bacterium]|nr:hypothetical protein [Phycisphaerales bacterium]